MMPGLPGAGPVIPPMMGAPFFPGGFMNPWSAMMGHMGDMCHAALHTAGSSESAMGVNNGPQASVPSPNNSSPTSTTDIDYPDTGDWVAYCDSLPKRSRASLGALRERLLEQGFFEIDQLTRDNITISDLVSSLGVGTGIAALIIRYADEDVARVPRGPGDMYLIARCTESFRTIVHRYPKARRRGIAHGQGLPLPFNHCFQKDCNLRISAKKLDWNEALRSSSRPSKHGGRDQLDVARQQELLASPIKPRSNDSSSPALASSLSLFPALNASTTGAPPAAGKNAAPLALPLPAVLRQPEEQTDNWDDDFEEGISFSKLQGISRRVLLHPRNQSKNRQWTKKNNNLNTTTTHKQSGPRTVLHAQRQAPHRAIVEDYSDLGIDEDDKWQEKFADFKMKTSVRRGLFHPNDIKPVGLAPVSPSVKSDIPAQSHPLNPVTPLSALPTGTRSHSRSPSFAGSSSGSLGRSDVRRLASQEFNKHAEDDDEDYDTLQLNTRLSNKSWLVDEDTDEEVPFAEGHAEDDLEANLQRDKHARFSTPVNQLIDELTPSALNFQLRDANSIVSDAPEDAKSASLSARKCLRFWKRWKDGDLVKSACGSYRSSMKRLSVRRGKEVERTTIGGAMLNTTRILP
ncbi:hypothetical protein BJV77DRAFT_962669 [Russula vinacea]|nr:hypothetical protein BJV77DRAFT_962669 [Russula vinacea]